MNGLDVRYRENADACLGQLNTNTVFSPDTASDGMNNSTYLDEDWLPSSSSPTALPSDPPAPAPLRSASVSEPGNTLARRQVRQGLVPSAPIILKGPGVKYVQGQASVANECSVGFIGLFFSTFFGGHTSDWASPKDQYSYFRDFGMWINS